MQEIEKILMHKFKRKELVVRAFNHRSTTSLKESYERLEFIGDRVIGLVVADMLLSKYPMAKEGELASRYIAIVRAETLADVARACGLGNYIKVSDNKEQMKNNNKILSDITEACIGALFRDGGLTAVRPFVEKYIKPLLEASPDDLKDSKTKLQEWSQKNKYGIPEYKMFDRLGTAHEPEFIMAVHIADFPLAYGSGKSKQQASQKSAQIFMEEHNIK